ncbi:response regulator [Anaeromyxobacter oryzae]|uniref:Response regulatory domain-containing protein n=1 Tax=Anaeromyxobacter oryzae TaxID=2918170 RepID=A0ABN6MS15_9BACT|nr:response regulator [Anaeromyxobacter oryzae]BDG03741.1 hypothetical protein AMOR_27370 [Anaeromyxobacter oryzae]
MDAPAPDHLRARIQALEAELRALHDENDRLAEAQTDAVLLGFLAEHVRAESEPDGILRAGLERMSVLKDLSLTLACAREGDRLVARAVHVASGDPVAGEVALTPAAEVLTALGEGVVVPLSGAEACADAGLGAGALPGGVAPRAVLLLPFQCRAFGAGVFVLADERGEARLVQAAAVLERAAEIVVGRLDLVALEDALRRASAALEQRRAEPGLAPPPAAEPAARASAPEPARAERGRGETVLLVDDEPLVRRALGRVLEGRGYVVVPAASAEEALGILAGRGGVDLLLTDVSMPGMRGPELVRAFQARCPGRPTLLMSGYPEAAAGEKLGGTMLEKPISPDALARAVRDALDAAVGRAAG